MLKLNGNNIIIKNDLNKRKSISWKEVNSIQTLKMIN